MQLIYDPHKPQPSHHRNVMQKLRQHVDLEPDTLTDDLELLETLLQPTIDAFESEIMAQKVAVVYLYDEREQPQHSPLRGVDGINLRHQTASGLVIHSIGIEVRTIRRHDAAQYLPLLFLHELCHCFVGPAHDSNFENFLNYLLLELAERTGQRLQNDLAGFTGDEPSTIND